MTGYNHPDDLYADALAKDQKPTGAYRAPAELSPAERKLRTALAYVCHARDLIREALGDNDPKAQREAKIAYDMACDTPAPERVPKWDVRWARGIGNADAAHIQRSHPMHAETLRDHDERLNGAEDKL